MSYITNRLREPSTWGALGILYVAVEQGLSSGNWTIALPAVLAALIGVLKGDAKA